MVIITIITVVDVLFLILWEIQKIQNTFSALRKFPSQRKRTHSWEMDHHQQRLNMSHQSSKLWWKVLSMGWDAQGRLLRRDVVEAKRRIRVQNVLQSHQEESNSSGILQIWWEKGDSSLWLQGPHCVPRKQVGRGAFSSCSGSLSRWVVLGQEPSPQLWASTLSHPIAVRLHYTT